ncbi:DUF4232 domain-containing protein [Saccharopolyspora sp. NPDC002686]|uniref:DUF4232 domain-containing protein n=1 Tax=Saccharopolyspora sp. NPDC002686 TaxID=3154541 RepID=UPI00332C1D26
MTRGRSTALPALTAAAAALLAACGQNPAQQAPPPATVTVTQPAPQESSEAKEDAEAQESSAADESTADSAGSAEENPSQGPCRTSQLRARFYPNSVDGLQKDPSQPPDRAHAMLRFANVGASPCTVEGAARLEFVGHSGELLGSTLDEVTHAPTEAISIGTREGVGQDLWWKYDPFKDGACIDPAKVRVYPPENTEPITLDWNLSVICAGGTLETSLFFRN